MSVILLSIGSYTFASNPAEIFWIDVWVNSTTGQLIGGSTDYQAEVPGAHLSDSPRRVSTELDESRAPFYAIEAFCIAVFTLEYFVRLFASPQGPGVIPFVIGLWNVVVRVVLAAAQCRRRERPRGRELTSPRHRRRNDIHTTDLPIGGGRSSSLSESVVSLACYCGPACKVH